jgi:hypothetical protein
MKNLYQRLLPKIKHLLSRRFFFMLISLPLALGILGWLIWRQKDVLISYQWSIHMLPVGLAFLVYSVVLFGTTGVWSWMMRVFGGSAIGYWKHFRVFCISALGKRLPGTVWYIAWRAQIYNQDGYSSRQVSLASGVEAAVSTLSAVIVSAIFAIPILMEYRLAVWGLVLMFMISFVLLQPRVIHWIWKRLGIEEGILRRRELVAWTLIYVIIRIFVGLMFFLVINILYPLSIDHLPYVIGSQAMVACLGMALFFFPSNFGFAEVSLSLLLTKLMPSSIAVIVVLVNRILMIFFEFVWAAGSVLTEFVLKKRG